ncbi:orotidine 5'-phosphate decarboxylase [Blastocladiella emersonii ATCC 22665]|nr:orotidine 5'-phosphate decarboxylase [Blastocladiella emersonii ATCC 22665]
MSTTTMKRSTYEARRANFAHNAAAVQLLDTMVAKQSNLCVSADLTKAAEVLALADAVGPHIAMLKTHVDIIEDFSAAFVDALAALAAKHRFVLFEDRKFADIGNTVKLQYAAGVHRIAEWAHFTNAHPLPGEGIVTGLAAEGVPRGRALLLLAQMSSAGSLFTDQYTAQAVAMAERNPQFCVGFIAQRRLPASRDFLVLTPGVGLDDKGDAMGQQYRSPHEVVVESGCDVIIVGRGIYKPGRDPVAEAKRYQAAGWEAYLASLAA